MSEDERFQQRMQQIESMLDARIVEVKDQIMSRLDEMLSERILSGREAVLAAMEKVPVETME